jgi:hypothetical protein
MPEQDVQQLVTLFDKNKDGLIQIEEFVVMISGLEDMQGGIIRTLAHSSSKSLCGTTSRASRPPSRCRYRGRHHVKVPVAKFPSGGEGGVGVLVYK